MIEKRFFLSNLLKTHFSFTFAISQNSKRAPFVQNNPQKTEKNKCFQIFPSIWDILERNLNAGDI